MLIMSVNCHCIGSSGVSDVRRCVSLMYDHLVGFTRHPHRMYIWSRSTPTAPPAIGMYSFDDSWTPEIPRCEHPHTARFDQLHTLRIPGCVPSIEVHPSEDHIRVTRLTLRIMSSLTCTSGVSYPPLFPFTSLERTSHSPSMYPGLWSLPSSPHVHGP